MTKDENRALARRGLDEVWSGGDLSVVDEIYASSYVFRDADRPEVKGLDEFKQTVAMYRTAFEDLHFAAKERFVDGDMVMTRWVSTSRHGAEFLGIAPTGKRVSVTGFTLDRIEDDRIAESWTTWDTLGLLQQLGAVPEMSPA